MNQSAPAIADCHNDLLMAVRHQRERGHEDPFGEFWLPQLRAGGVKLQVLPVCTEEQFVGEGALRHSFLMMEEARHLAEVHADSVMIAETGTQLREGLQGDKIVLVLAIEGAEPIGHSIEVLDIMYRVGVRMCSLSWNRRTMMADGIAETDTGGRLTSLGVRAVQRMQEIGMIVDVSHLSQAGFFHLAEVATEAFIASHSSCRDVTDHPRNLSDDQLRIMADTGSMVCINAFGPFIADTDPDVDSFVDHVEHALELVGSDLVGLGTDFIDDVADVVDPIFTGLLIGDVSFPITKDLQRPSHFQGLVARMQDRLGNELATKVVGTNLMDFIAARI